MNTREKLFLVWAVVATVLLIVVGVMVLLKPQPQLANTVRIGGVLDFPVGSHTLFTCNRMTGSCEQIQDSAVLATNLSYHDAHLSDYQEPWIWVTHDSDNTWRAFLAVSPHRGCFVNWIPAKKQFQEPCYGSKWAADGEYEQGPSPRGLDRYPIRAEFGNVWLDFNLAHGANHN